MATVSLIPAQSYELSQLRPSLERLLEPLGSISTYVKPGDRVLLKPNLLTASAPNNACITRPEVVYCVAALVKSVGGDPFLGDSPAFGSAHGVAKANGYLPLMSALDIPIVEFHGQRHTIENPEFQHLRLSTEALGADVIINLPKVKSHAQLTLTLGVKNLFGCVPGKMKAWWHLEAGKDQQRFGQMLVETAKAINPHLTIIDGIIGQEGNGPIKGVPRPLNLLGASADVFALDRVLADILQVDPTQVPTIAAAIAQGLAPEIENINFPLGSPTNLSVPDWQLPEQIVPIDFGLPRIMRSTFKHLYIRWIKEPIAAYSSR